MVYPEKIFERLRNLRGSRKQSSQFDAEGVAANFECGSFTRVFIYSAEDGMVGDLRYQTNGCGYMVVAADILAENIRNSDLRALHGLQAADLRSQVEMAVGPFTCDRGQCLETVIEAVRNAFADLRRRQVEEFRGETALICTCFGVTQERIDGLIRTGRVRSVDEVTDATKAGSGCGSCRMLIQEILDQQEPA